MAVHQENDAMETIKILPKTADVSWDYDDEADVLSVSVGERQPAVGVDVGEGITLGIDETQTLVGLTLVGWGSRLMQSLATSHEPTSVLREQPVDYTPASTVTISLRALETLIRHVVHEEVRHVLAEWEDRGPTVIEPGSPLYQDLEDIAERAKEGKLVFHGYDEVWD
jgi:hypothetical protein